MKRILLFILLSLSLTIFSQPREGYYNSAVGYTEATLKTKLCAIVGPHTARTYADLWNDFKTTDKRADGKVWDIYSNTTNYTFISNQCGNYSGEGVCYNREHSFPKSWFNDATPMYTELFHLYPSDGYVNGKRSNYPFGEVGTVSYSSNNNYCRLGSSSVTGYSGVVFEPADELKGDMARTYFYMVTAYDNKVAGWVSDQLSGNQYPALSAWSVTLFLKWNAQDPVSTKEINRNNAIYGIQGNRNPFIDYPELAEYIWGNKRGTPWSLTPGVDKPDIEFSIYPNPVQDEIVIQSPETNFSYTIFNLNGSTLSKGQLNIEKKISVKPLQNGMYLLQLESDSCKCIRKFVINR